MKWPVKVFYSDGLKDKIIFNLRAEVAETG